MVEFIKRYPEGFKSWDHFAKDWEKKVHPSFEDKCSYCFEELIGSFSAIGMGIESLQAKLIPIIENYAGLYIPMFFWEDEKVISSLIPEIGSQAKIQGWVLSFAVCDKCHPKLKSLLKKYNDPKKTIGLINIDMPMEEIFEQITMEGVKDVTKMLALLQTFLPDDKKIH